MERRTKKKNQTNQLFTWEHFSLISESCFDDRSKMVGHVSPQTSQKIRLFLSWVNTKKNIQTHINTL